MSNSTASQPLVPRNGPGLAQANFIGKDNTARQRILTREERRLNLVGIQIHLNVGQRSRKFLDTVSEVHHDELARVRSNGMIWVCPYRSLTYRFPEFLQSFDGHWIRRFQFLSE